MGLGKQVEPVLDSLWKISLPFVPSEPFVKELAEAEKDLVMEKNCKRMEIHQGKISS